MSLGFLRQKLERIGIYAWRTPPRGSNLFADIRNDLGFVDIKCVFDVGANVGQSTLPYLTEFRHAQIHCFEPVPTTFGELKKNVGGNPRVILHEVALGSKPGEAMIDPTDDSCTALISDRGTIRVAVETLDHIWNGQINFLKIDAEGHDLEVLRGATGLLRDRRIDILQVEVGMSPRHDLHVRLEDMKSFLESRGMELFSIVGQSPNYVPGAAYLQRADAVFISDDVVRRSQRAS